MDPQQAFMEMIDALTQRDLETVIERSESLMEWMNNGGFPPLIIGGDQLDDNWHRTVAKAICQLAHRMAKDGLDGLEPEEGSEPMC